MTEIDINNLNIAHQKEKVIKIFDNPKECLKFADKFEEEYHIKLSCGSIHSFLNTVETKGYFEGLKDSRGKE